MHCTNSEVQSQRLDQQHDQRHFVMMKVRIVKAGRIQAIVLVGMHPTWKRIVKNHVIYAQNQPQNQPQNLLQHEQRGLQLYAKTQMNFVTIGRVLENVQKIHPTCTKAVNSRAICAVNRFDILPFWFLIKQNLSRAMITTNLATIGLVLENAQKIQRIWIPIAKKAVVVVNSLRLQFRTLIRSQVLS